MERKIGEIFEYDGEWYQCVEGLYCDDCAFVNDNCEDRERITLREKLTKQPTTGFCNSEKRNDRKSVIFKKLEKVGEPYISSRNKRKHQLYRCFHVPIITTDSRIEIGDMNFIGIEIKQNKDMEEKKLNLKPFDIQKAREGKPVCTRDGRKARIICFDRKLFYRKVSYPILALVERSDGEDDVCGYNEKGKVLIEDGAEYKDDLMMLPEKRSGWAKVRKDINLYDTKEEADRKMIGNDEYVTAKVCWEE